MESPDALPEAGPTCGLAVDAGWRIRLVIQPRSPADSDLTLPFGLLGVTMVHHGTHTSLSSHTRALVVRRGRENATTLHTPKMAATHTTFPPTNKLSHTPEQRAATKLYTAAEQRKQKRSVAINQRQQAVEGAPVTSDREKPYPPPPAVSACTQTAATARGRRSTGLDPGPQDSTTREGG
ncbi:Hypothetical predicted protein [Pelobates cultripes]|uniref:Uncharacterized protein n=1 Tax=Pelobates cultripes TaxID=61616 RepID=A0AAD1TIL1_PELCU|nr:Hypothetical predicted protein [Pelobates cultripes]